MNISSAIYEGEVRHRRFAPKKHEFTYSLYLTSLNLDEVKELFPLPWYLRWINFKRRNYLDSPVEDLKEAVWQRVEYLGGQSFGGQVCILTNLSYLGYCFNPVSFYYCYDTEGGLRYVLSEINNTPWGERYCYLTKISSEDRVHCFSKGFHVSPFMPMEMDYKWYFSKAAERLNVHMKNFEEGKELFNATLSLKRKELSYSSLFKMAIKQPLIPFKVIIGIYWNALLLKLKGVSFYENPSSRLKQENVHYES